MLQDRHVNDHAADPADAEPGRSRAPNIRDVARLAGVSYQTVSRVLNDHPSIRDSTRERVLAVIAETGYRPNPAARALVTSRSRTIGVLSSQSSQYGPATSIAAIEIAARDAGYRSSVTSIATTDVTSIRAALDYLMSQSVEALVVIAPQQRVLEVIAEILPGGRGWRVRIACRVPSRSTTAVARWCGFTPATVGRRARPSRWWTATWT